MKKILVTGVFQGAVELVYSEGGMGADAEPSLISVNMAAAGLTDEQKRHLLYWVPLRYGGGYEQNWGKMNGRVQITTEDWTPDFDADFWWTYGWAVHRQRAEKEWDRLTKVERVLAVARLPAYLRFLSRRGTGKAEPGNYLKGKYFKNDYDNL